MEKLRVGLIGCGEAVQILHLPSLYQLSDQFEVTALCDVSRHVVEELGARWNIKKRFVDDRELLAQDDVDAIVIASPNHYHASTTLNAIEAGKHVLVEKPMCITLRDADAVIEAAAQSGVTVQVAYMRLGFLGLAILCVQWAIANARACTTLSGKTRSSFRKRRVW